ncbi:MAG TPA: pilus assembly protein PilC [Deltaproteobacteria bacterium]|nr:MAG: pilus assembly protein PilC [Deltaproteobacteria bacterium GWA2_55_82]OGQ64697.1 MAG: pilus assembly protein PilC [Deltaproteobacteria bacterium RIFCSPLOWO2_02_FULL_55_12]OIJ73169.1 MAG: pilus assembly protein PilC [Deltaproteobacteria bacterium GWC2_55_46]HBG45576.1 pilus assembly protein PilC [Deltaproteobacteria bacterium]HCY10407.1 pilus assembly protein PilC [Deltaproteobacteria bacterium]
MPIFVYSGRTLSGDGKKGEIEAASLAQATAALRRQQIMPASISQKKAGFALSDIKIPGLGKGVKTKDIVIFSRQFATMIDAGLPLVQCLDILASQQENAEFKKVLLDVKSSVEGGSTFADALKKHPKVFDDLYVNLIAAGEIGGILDTILNRLSSFLEKSEKLKGKVKSAMTYPTAVIVIASLVVSGLLLWVVPIFEDMFSGFGQALPAPTQMVVKMSNVLKSYWYAIIATGVGIGVGLNRAYKTPKGRRVMDKTFLKLPVLGDLIRKTAVARFTRTLGTMLSSGVPILEGLEIVSKTAGNVIIEEAVLKARTSLSQGKTLADPLMETKVFPGMVTQMIAVGESTGALDTMLTKIADFYEEEVDQAVEALTSLIEPLLMAFLGIVVGGLVIALYLPIFQIAGAAGS